VKGTPHPADELAEVRVEIARLRLRAAQLRDQILARPDALTSGRWFEVTISENTLRRLDLDKLPEQLRYDPLYFSERRHIALHCHAKPLGTLQTQRPLFSRNQVQ
jgi:hypothetical protein